jgi:hypothetical protein
MADNADDYTIQKDYTTGMITVKQSTEFPDMTAAQFAAGKAAAQTGMAAWNAWINAQPWPPTVKEWHTAVLSFGRREGLRLLVANSD